MKTTFKSVVGSMLAVAAATASAQSAPYPAKPIRFVVGFPPGGSADATVRIVGAALSEQVGRPVVIDNRSGADGALSAELVTRAPADGYSIVFGSVNSMTASVVLRKSPPYDPTKDFTPISMLGRATLFLYSHPSVPAKTLSEFIAHAKANPGKLVYGTGNAISMLLHVQIARATDTKMLNVPYKGEGPLTPDLLAGRLHLAFISTLGAISLAKEGKIRPLAVLLQNRSALLPDVPTIDEAGLPQATVRHWAGVFGPANMPREVVQRLNKEIVSALKRPEVLDKLLSYGYVVESSTPEELAAINRNDLVLWRRLVKEAGILVE
jgi:tripartite-type tricarboxylate transporter receptor subunit TctC